MEKAPRKGTFNPRVFFERASSSAGGLVKEERWEKVKAVFKEMKRRRGSGNAIKIRINFAGNPKIIFTIDSEDRQWFDNAIEKIDFVLELLPYHLDPEKLPSEISKIRRFSPNPRRSHPRNFSRGPPR